MSPNDNFEERLRRALSGVADSTDVSSDAWDRVEQRSRHRRVPRVALAVAAAMSVVVIATATVVLVASDDNDGDPSITAAGDRMTACGAAPPADLEVWLEPGATAPQRDAVERILADSLVVESYSFQSQEEGARIFECVYFDEPDRVTGADLGRIPPAFYVTLAAGSDASALLRALESETGVLTASRRGGCTERADAEVFMVVAPTSEEVEAVRAAMDEAAGVAEVVFVSKEAAHQEFACLFQEKPDLVRETSPEALPPLFRITLEPGADYAALREQLEVLPGVDAVIDHRYPIVEPVPEVELDEPPSGYAEVANGVDPVSASPWRLLLGTSDDGQYWARAVFPDGDVTLIGVDEIGCESSGSAGSTGGRIIAAFCSEATRVRLESDGRELAEVETITSEDVRTRFVVTRLPIGVPITAIVFDGAGNEIHRTTTLELTGP